MRRRRLAPLFGNGLPPPTTKPGLHQHLAHLADLMERAEHAFRIDIRPRMGRIRPKSHNSARPRAKPGRTRANFGRHRANFVGLGTKSAEIDQRWSNSTQVRAHQKRPSRKSSGVLERCAQAGDRTHEVARADGAEFGRMMAVTTIGLVSTEFGVGSCRSGLTLHGLLIAYTSKRPRCATREREATDATVPRTGLIARAGRVTAHSPFKATTKILPDRCWGKSCPIDAARPTHFNSQL